jgi:hypothetical protein
MTTNGNSGVPTGPTRAYAWSFRLGPWLLVGLGLVLVVYGCVVSTETELRATTITLGSLLAVAGVALPRVRGDIALDSRGFRAKIEGIEQLDPSALAAAVAEVAEEAIPDDYPGKDELVRTFAVKAVQTWGDPATLAGTWWARLAPHAGEPGKLDRVELQVSGEDLVADIRRVQPVDQSDRRWRFAGKVRGSFLFGMFYTTTPDINALSYGTIQLRRQDPAATVWSGFYIRLEIRSVGEGWSKSLEPISLEWRRLQPGDSRSLEGAP